MTSTFSERYVKSSSARLWTVSSGTGEAVLCFNGGPGCDDYLEPVAQLIHNDYQVVRFEPRGCGRSDWDGRYDLDTVLEDAEAIRMAYGLERWVLLGHSHGPNVALAYAMRYPERTIGIVGIAGGKVCDSRSWSALYRERLERVGELSAKAHWHADPEVNPQGNANWQRYCERPTLLRDLAELQIPCVFINASEDIRPNWPTHQLAALIPNARYEEIMGASHAIWLTHAEELKAKLREGLDFIEQNNNS